MTTTLTPEALAELAAVGITRADQLEVVEAVADEVLVRASLAGLDQFRCADVCRGSLNRGMEGAA